VALKQVIAAHKCLQPNMYVLTKLDEANTLGGALSVAIDEELKIVYQCARQLVSEDLNQTDATDLIAHTVSMKKKYSSESDKVQIEQGFGKHSVYHSIGEHYEH